MEWDYQRDSVLNQTMTLLLNKEFSKYLNELSLWSDSIGSTPEGVKRLNELIMAQCVIHNPDGSVTVDYSKSPIKKGLYLCF